MLELDVHDNCTAMLYGTILTYATQVLSHVFLQCVTTAPSSTELTLLL